MRTFGTACLIYAASFLATSTTQFVSAATITFDTVDLGLWDNSTGFETQGFQVTGSSPAINIVTDGLSCSPPCAQNGTPYLYHQHHQSDYQPGLGITFTPLSGETFTLFNFDAAETHLDRQFDWAESVLVVGTYEDGTITSQNFELDWINDAGGPLSDFETFTLSASFSNLASVTFDGIGGIGWFSMDNVNIDIALPPTTEPPSPIPIPAAAWLFASALGVFGYLGKRKAKSITNQSY